MRRTDVINTGEPLHQYRWDNRGHLLPCADDLSDVIGGFGEEGVRTGLGDSVGRETPWDLLNRNSWYIRGVRVGGGRVGNPRPRNLLVPLGPFVESFTFVDGTLPVPAVMGGSWGPVPSWTSRRPPGV